MATELMVKLGQNSSENPKRFFAHFVLFFSLGGQLGGQMGGLYPL